MISCRFFNYMQAYQKLEENHGSFTEGSND